MNPRIAIPAWTATLFVALSAASCCSAQPKAAETSGGKSAASAESGAKSASADSSGAAAAGAAGATAMAATKTNEGPVAGVLEKSQTATATVTAIDAATRRVTLRNETGNEFVVVCGEEVRNLPQVKVGDI